MSENISFSSQLADQAISNIHNRLWEKSKKTFLCPISPLIKLEKIIDEDFIIEESKDLMSISLQRIKLTEEADKSSRPIWGISLEDLFKNIDWISKKEEKDYEDCIEYDPESESCQIYQKFNELIDCT